MRSPTRTGKSLAGLPAGPGAEGVGEGGLWEGESVRRCPRVKHSPETHLRNARSHFEKRIARRRKMHLKNAAPCFGKRSFENAVRVAANAETVDVCTATHRAACFCFTPGEDGSGGSSGWLQTQPCISLNAASCFEKRSSKTQSVFPQTQSQSTCVHGCALHRAALAPLAPTPPLAPPWQELRLDGAREWC